MFLESILRERIHYYAGPQRVQRRLRVFEDTSDFFQLEYNDVLILDEVPYLIGNNQKEGRFGMDDEPKFWVKRAVALDTGAVKILKMVFHETFQASIGDMVFECARSPEKEARILDLVRGHANFMQGFAVRDVQGNIVRVLDYIAGSNLGSVVRTLAKNHEVYFHKHLGKMLDVFIELIEAIHFLHTRGEKHGDIRRDHILREHSSGRYFWIDFDYDYQSRDNYFGYDLFGLGSVLVLIVGGGDVTLTELKRNNPAAFARLSEDDVNLVFKNRVVNLKKVYPYILELLNRVMMPFSQGSDTFYETSEQLAILVRQARDELD